MDSYIDISLRPKSGMQVYLLMNQVYSKLHKALFVMVASEIGVSFPNYQSNLGSVLRLHSDKAALVGLQSLDWLSGLQIYCHVSLIKDVPKKCKYRVVSRIQNNMSKAKLRRLIKRGSISEHEILAYKSQMQSTVMNYPFVELKSMSNGQKHRRYIKLSSLYDNEVKGKFDSFGLSKSATVPWF